MAFSLCVTELEAELDAKLLAPLLQATVELALHRPAAGIGTGELFRLVDRF